MTFLQIPRGHIYYREDTHKNSVFFLVEPLREERTPIEEHFFSSNEENGRKNPNPVRSTGAGGGIRSQKKYISFAFTNWSVIVSIVVDFKTRRVIYTFKMCYNIIFETLLL